MFTKIGVIGRKLLFIVLFLAIVPIFVLGVIAVHHEANTIHKQTLVSLEIIAERVKGDILGLIKYYKARTQDSSSDGFIHDSLEKINSNFLNSSEIVKGLHNHLAKNKLPILENAVEVCVLDCNGKVVSSSDQSQIGGNYINAAFFKYGSNKIYVSDIIQLSAFQKPVWIFSAPIFNNKLDTFLGVIVNKIDPQILNNVTVGKDTFFFNDVKRFTRFGVTGESYIVNKRKLMITESRFFGNVILQQIVDTEPVRMIFEHGKELLSSYLDYRGVPIIGASKYIEEPGWLILTEIDEKEAFLSTKSFIIKAIIITLLFVPIIFFSTLFVIRKIVSPIIKIADASDRITQGHWNEVVSVNDKKGEIFKLANSFNAMVKSLFESHNVLETRVMERTAELKAANNEIKRFAYIVSHDLRAPLVNIRGFSNELRLSIENVKSICNSILSKLTQHQNEEMLKLLNEDIPEALKFIELSTNRLDRLICSVLSLSRIEHRGMDFEVVNMNNIVDDAINSMAHLIDIEGIKIKKGKLPEIIADKLSMEQVICNIFSNSIKYLYPERSGEIEITSDQNENEFIFQISDNGRGIEKEHIDKIFEIFYRANKTEISGDGMGLAYVKAIVQKHGGNVWCKSQFGRQTTMIFSVSKKLSVSKK